MRPLHVCTLLTQKPPQILSYINKLSEKFSGKDCTFLFALSSNFDHPNDLEEVVCTMRNLRRDRGKGKARLIGCLSGPVSDMELPGGNHAGLSCAVAVYNSMHCVPFHSRLQGRKEAQVGRWHSFRPDSSPTLDLLEVRKGENVNWEDVWNNKISSSINRDIVSEELRLISPSKIHSLLYMTMPNPDLFTFALSRFLSSSSSCMSLGLIAAPTQFVTGRDVTIFFDDKIYGNGTVGLAFVKSEDSEEETLPKIATDFIDMQKLGERLIVTSAEGNMVNSLDGSNPTQHLLRAIEGAEISHHSTSSIREEEQFALGILSPAGDILRTLKITAGDPTSRGGCISLDTVEAPTQGSIVQFLRRLPNSPLKMPSSLLSLTQSSIAYLTVPESVDDRFSGTISEVQPLILPDTFFATSTSGFLLSQFGSDPHRNSIKHSDMQEDQWSCSLHGGMAVLTYH